MHTLGFMCPCSIMSAIDMFATFKVIEGKSGEKRIAITLNGTAFSRCSVCFNRLLSRTCNSQARSSGVGRQLACPLQDFCAQLVWT